MDKVSMALSPAGIAITLNGTTEFTSDSCQQQGGAYLEYTGGQTRWMSELARTQLVFLCDNMSSNICKDRTNTLTNATSEALGLWPLIGD